MDYFVMLNFPGDHPIPLMDAEKEDAIAWFDSINSARLAAEQNGLGDAYGYEIFCLGEGHD